MINEPKEELTHITVMTFNIQHGLGMDHKIDIHRIASLINKFRPTLVGCQEVDEYTMRNPYSQTDVLAQLTHMVGVFGKAVDSFGGEYGNAILSKVPILEKRHIIFKYKTEEFAESRGALAVLAKISEKKKLWFVTTHLDFRKDERQYIQFLEFWNFLCNLMKETPTTPFIVTGDFNNYPSSKICKKMKERFVDVWEAKGKGHGHTVPSDIQAVRIDYIFVDKRIDIENAAVDCSVASDHCLLVAHLQI